MVQAKFDQSRGKIQNARACCGNWGRILAGRKYLTNVRSLYFSISVVRLKEVSLYLLSISKAP